MTRSYWACAFLAIVSVVAACEARAQDCRLPKIPDAAMAHTVAMAPASENPTRNTLGRVHVVIDHSEGMSGFVRSTGQSSELTLYASLIGDRLLTRLHTLADEDSLRFYHLSHSQNEGRVETIDEGEFKNSTKSRSCSVTGKVCRPYYFGWGPIEAFLNKIDSIEESGLDRSPGDVVILISDLLHEKAEDSGDGGPIGTVLKRNVLNGKTIGLIGVKSRFYGYINDLPGTPTWRGIDGSGYSGQQPFYVLLIGSRPQVLPLFEELRRAFDAGSNDRVNAQLFDKSDRHLGATVSAAELETKAELVDDPLGVVQQVDLPFEMFGDTDTPFLSVPFPTPKLSTSIELNQKPKKGKQRLWVFQDRNEIISPKDAEKIDACGRWLLIGNAKEAGIDVSEGEKTKNGEPALKFRLPDANNNYIGPGRIYFVEQEYSLAWRAEPKTPEWVREWSVSQKDLQDKEFIADIASGNRPHVGTGGLTSLFEILNSAARRKDTVGEKKVIYIAFRIRHR